jgi:hypothetical protein
MFEECNRRGWRGAIGLITAYAFVLQVFLAYSIASQAAVLGNSSGAFFVICVNADTGAAAGGETKPGTPTTHCPICTLTGASAAIVPDLVQLPMWQPASAQRTPFVSGQACIHFHRARAGLSRAPPLHV